MIYESFDHQRIQNWLSHFIFDDAPPFTTRKVWLEILKFDKECNNRPTHFTYKELTEYIRQMYMDNRFGKDWVYLKRPNKTDLYFRISKINKFLMSLSKKS